MADSTYATQGAIVAAGAPTGESGVATLARAIADGNGVRCPAGFGPVQTLTDAATVTQTVNPVTGCCAGIVTLGGNRTLAISGAVAGSQGILFVKQDGTGSRTLALPSNNLINAAYTPTTTATTGLDMLTWYYDGTNFNFGVPAKALAAH